MPSAKGSLQRPPLVSAVLVFFPLVATAIAQDVTASPSASPAFRPPPMHKCIHDDLALEAFRESPPISGAQSYQYQATVHPDTGAPLLAPGTWAPIRVGVEYLFSFDIEMETAGTGLSTWVRDLMSEAATKLREALKVRPVVGKLQAHRECYDWDIHFTPAICNRYRSINSVTMPGLTGVPDYVIEADYLAQDDVIVFVDGENRKTTLPAGSKGWDADVLFFVSGIQTSICGNPGAGGGTIAYALYWQKDQQDRPVIARINLCPAMAAEFRATGRRDGFLQTIMHEMVHNLGMSATLYPYYRQKDAASTPLTKRDPLYPWLPDEDYIFEYKCNGQNYSVYKPEENTVQWFEERGMDCVGWFDDPEPQGQCVMRLVTPAAKKAAQAFFFCPSLPGAELENE
jgi:Leishmanolysin